MRSAGITAGAELRPTTAIVSTSPRAQGVGFSVSERRLLLGTRGISHGVINRIERIGVQSLQQLRELGVDVVVNRICDGVGNFAWRNRQRALQRALAAVAGEPALSN